MTYQKHFPLVDNLVLKGVAGTVVERKDEVFIVGTSSQRSSCVSCVSLSPEASALPLGAGRDLIHFSAALLPHHALDHGVLQDIHSLLEAFVEKEVKARGISDAKKRKKERKKNSGRA